jgi:hypothetical protein
MNDNAVQRTLMIILPVLVGAETSKYFVDPEFIQFFLILLRRAALIFFVFIIITTGVISNFTLPKVTGLAAEAITSSLFAVIFVVEYVYRYPNAWIYWLMMCLVPFIALTRTGIVVNAITMPCILRSEERRVGKEC